MAIPVPAPAIAASHNRLGQASRQTGTRILGLTGHVRRAQVLLLLAPALGDEAADAPAARSALSEAMRTLGAAEDTTDLAALAVSDEVVFWGHVPWVAGEPTLDNAPRNPASPFALPAADRRQVAELLKP
jgi:hypothetical protein